MGINKRKSVKKMKNKNIENNRIKIGKPKDVFNGRIFTIKQAKGIHPGGTVETFEYCERQPTVMIIAIDKNDKVLLIREYREKHKKTMWRLPGGGVDKELAPKKAAQRELREETGYRAKKLKLFTTSYCSQTLMYKSYLYLASDFIKDPLPKDEFEEIKVVPTSLSKVYKMALNGTIGSEFINLGIIQFCHKTKKVAEKIVLKELI